LLKTEVLALKIEDLDIEAKLTILDSRKASTSYTPNITLDITEVPDSNIPESQFLQTISQVTFQKWYSIVKLIVNDFSTNSLALIDSGADQNCIRGGIIPTKYCECAKKTLS